MTLPPPFNLQRWIAAHRHELVPPVANRTVFPAGDLIVMVVGGPNSRTDFHVDPGAEFFHQLEGRLTLRTIEDGRLHEHVLEGGDVLLLPPLVPHSPQRAAGSIGLVVERRRRADERDGLQWYCEVCGALLYEEFLQLEDIETQFPPVFERFYGDLARRSCRACGAVLEPPTVAPVPR